jgi:hypothetical protein
MQRPVLGYFQYKFLPYGERTNSGGELNLTQITNLHNHITCHEIHVLLNIINFIQTL